ncbi:MAG: hypothetical protein WCD18_26945, partial [Thermosynechococcaceae cyanobacterium]
MPTLLERLPDISALDGELGQVLNQLTNLATKAQDFSSGDLQAVLAAGENLPIPDSFALVSGTVTQFGDLLQRLPDDPEEITAVLKAGLEELLSSSSGLGELISPITQILETIAPLLSKFELLTASVTRINTFTSGLTDQVGSLNLANLPDQLAYFARVFESFPEAAAVSPLKELKAQVDALNTWLSATPTGLTQQFLTQIQALANALPLQLTAAMQVGLDAIALIETPLTGLNPSQWLDPYNEALAAVEALDLTDFSQLNAYAAILDAQIAQTTAIATPLTQNIQTALSRLEQFDVTAFAQNWQDAFQTILNTISPATPSILAKLFNQIEKLVGSIEIGPTASILAGLEEQINGLFGEVNFTELTTEIETLTTQITSAVNTVDQALVTVATFLSNLATELRTLISKVDLPKLLNQVKTEFDQLSAQVNSLLSQVNQIPQQLNALANELKTDVEGLDINDLKDSISDLLGEITGVLSDPQIQQIRQEAQQGIDAIAQNLASVSLKPIFDRVVAEMGEVKSKLAAVDVSQLNELLKEALKAALAEITDLNFAQEVADVLKQAFQEILSRATGLIQPLQEKYLEILERITAFEPGTWVAQNLTPPFETLLAELQKIEPAKLLEPLKALYESVLAQLEPLSPATLLAPLSDFHGQLLSALQSLSPQDLIAPLNALLSQVTGILDQLGIETFIATIQDSVGQINTLIGNFSVGEQLQNTDFFATFTQLPNQVDRLLQDAETLVDQYLDRLVEAIPTVDIGILQPALDQLTGAIATIEGHISTPAVLTHLQDLTATLNQPAFQGGVTALTQRWVAQKTRFASVTPPPDQQLPYNALKVKLQVLSPIQVLGTPAALVDRMSAAIATLQANLTRRQQGLINLLDQNQSKLAALLPTEATAAGFKQLLRDALEEQIGAPAKAVVEVLKAQLARFDPLFELLKGVVLKLRSPLEALTVIPNSIGQIGDALIQAKTKITAVNLNFLADELQGVINEVITQFSALNPASLASSLNTTYQNMLKALDTLYPAAAIQTVDDLYRNVVLTKLEALHPDEILAPPLNEAFKSILDLQKAFDVSQIFDVLIEKFDTLG